MDLKSRFPVPNVKQKTVQSFNQRFWTTGSWVGLGFDYLPYGFPNNSPLKGKPCGFQSPTGPNVTRIRQLHSPQSVPPTMGTALGPVNYGARTPVPKVRSVGWVTEMTCFLCNVTWLVCVIVAFYKVVRCFLCWFYRYTTWESLIYSYILDTVILPFKKCRIGYCVAVALTVLRMVRRATGGFIHIFYSHPENWGRFPIWIFFRLVEGLFQPPPLTSELFC